MLHKWRSLANLIIVLVVGCMLFAVLNSLTMTPYTRPAMDEEIIDSAAIERFERRLSKTLEVLHKQPEPCQKTKSKDLPTIYVITPTFKRYEQIPELTRLGQTLLNVPKLHWIVGDDRNVTNQEVIDFLDQLGIPYTYLLTPMPEKFHDPKYKAKPKGVANRNAGMDWLRKHATEGVFYLADDDNTYDIRLFEEIRRTKKISMFPVGFMTAYGLSTPIVKDGKFAGWYDGWIGNRKFPVDMAGFAVSVPFLLTKPDAKMPFTAGYEETGFLGSLNISNDEIEFLADNCTKIYVWHTKTQKVYSSSRDILNSKYNGTNLRELQKVMVIKKEQ